MYHGAPKLDELITKHPGRRPRNVTASDEEKMRVLNAAQPHMKLYILLCSDLAIRSGTTARLGPEHYNSAQQKLSFTTKMGERLTLPVTEEIAGLIGLCNMDDRTPFVKQLWALGAECRSGPNPKPDAKTNPFNNQFAALRRSVGITRRLTPHDFRRTTAVRMLEATGDVRDVQALLGHRSLQSTVWYLDHDLRPVSRDTLEALKRPHNFERKIA
jgi:integrase